MPDHLRAIILRIVRRTDRIRLLYQVQHLIFPRIGASIGVLELCLFLLRLLLVDIFITRPLILLVHP